MAVREISTSIKLDGEQAFNDQMKALNNNTKTLRSEMSALSAEFASNAGSVEALTAKQAVQQEIVDQQAEKVRALEQAYSEVAEANSVATAQAATITSSLPTETFQFALCHAPASLCAFESIFCRKIIITRPMNSVKKTF